MLRRAGALLGATLVAFHLWLLASQAWTGQLAEPGLVLRWLVAGGLVVGLAVLRRRGEPVVFGRKAVTLWLLAALLHGPAITQHGLTAEAPGVPEAVSVATQVAVAALAAGLAALLLVAGARVRRLSAQRVTLLQRAALRAVSAATRGLRALAAPRPPPLPASC